MSEHDEDPRASMWVLIYGLFALSGGLIGAGLMWLVQRIWLHLAFVWCIGWFTLGLCASDVPEWVLRGIASQETGVHWTDTGDLNARTWPRGSTGAVGPWHLSLDVLADLKLSAHADRLHRDPVYAESITRLWLLHLYSVTGCWHQTCAAWRAGLRARHRAWARAYAERAFNYGVAY